MSCGMPELGSRISLISKADIRYEGRLFTVDPQECTIALAGVQSFGTEDRETACPIAPQSQIYEYILFRGSDIKDIRVINNCSIPNDPAIMQMHLPPTAPMMQPPNFQQPGAFNMPGGMPHPNMGNPPPPSQMANFGSFNSMAGFNNIPGGNVLAGAVGAGVIDPNKKPPQQQQQNKPIGSGPDHSSHNDQQNEHKDSGPGFSRSGTPASLNSRKSPTADVGVQANNRRGDGGGQGGRGGNDQGGQGGQGQRRNFHPNNQHLQRNDRGEMNNGPSMHQYRDHRDVQRRENYGQQYPFRNRDNNRGGGGGGDNRDNRDNRGGDNRDNNRGDMRQQQHQQQFRGPRPQNPWNNRNQNRNRYRGRQPQGTFGGPNRNQGGRGKNILKFENDYDFEQANNKFEELRSQLAKIKIGATEEAPPKQQNGEVDKKDDSGNETVAGEQEHEDESGEVGYDKSKSFFDNISCEAIERQKGKTPRPDWRQERKLNSETFGVSHNRRGNFRPRGGYRGPQNRGGGYRGRSGNRNNRNPNQPQQPSQSQNAQQQPQSSQQQALPVQQQPQQSKPSTSGAAAVAAKA